MVLLVGLGWWGHHTGWKVPAFSALVGNGTEDKADWCAAHAVAESQCVECQPGLLPKGKEHGFCTRHRVAECPLCNPDVAQLPSKPNITSEDLDRAKRALEFVDRSDNESKCKKHLRRIQFASQEAADKAGVVPGQVMLAPVVESVGGNGEITYDQTRVCRLSSRVPGSAWRVDKQVGDVVKQGDVLALVDGAEVGRAKAEFLQAYGQVQLKTETWERAKSGYASGALPERNYREIEAAFREARIRLIGARQALINLGLPIQLDDLRDLSEEKLALKLQFLGLPEAITAPMDPQTTSGNLLPIRAPIEGVIVGREVVAGEVVDAAKVLFVVADTRTMWLNLNVRLEDAKLLKPGQTVHFRPDGQAPASLRWYTVIGDRLSWNQTLDGKITWISTAVDDRTRTVKVRCEFANAAGRLRAGVFGSGRIVLREEQGVVVPKDAVQWEGCCHVVFVQDKNYHTAGAPKVYHVRKVVPGAAGDNYTEIIAGVLPGEVVADKGSGVLRTELLKNDLGDG
jgi:cobalt-zinc-cadmium efflux system membrane fusion protein